MNECPTQQLWQAVLEQRLPAAEEEALLRHAEACDACQQLLEALTCPPAQSLVRQVCDTHDSRAWRQTPPPSRFAARGDTSFTTLGLTAPSKSEHLPVVAGYEILEELGTGGMGVVFKARHVELNRIVALKMLRVGAMDHEELLARFRAEARAVARLQHPGIVQIHEVGTLEGRPYLALEYVPGPSLDRVLEGSPLAPRDAASLLLPLAEALQAAHQQGVLHRDLKPANVLLGGEVVELRGGGRDNSATTSPPHHLTTPKITDFGLAKPLDEDSGRTQAGMIVGTPSYMAPEQAAGERKLGPTADVYALGAILYECLTGRPPFRGVTAQDTVLQVQTEDPVPPRSLQPTVPRDLETICLKCLKKEPAKRYATAAALAADVRNYLEGKPILARPAGRWEQTVKWCRRYPAAAALLAVATLAAITTGALASLALRAAEAERQAKFEAQRERDEKEEARKKEEQARRKEEQERTFAQAITKFVKDDFLALTSVEGQDRFGGADKQTLTKDTTLRQLLDRAADKLRARQGLDPRIEAELCWIIGVNYRGAGAAKKGIGFLERAVQLRSDLLGRDHADTLIAMNSLAVAYEADGKLGLSLPLFAETFKLVKGQLGPDHPDTLKCMENLAGAYQTAGKLALALPLFEETLQFRKAQLGPDHPDTLKSMNSLARAYQAAGRLDRALPLFEETLQLRKAQLGPDRPDTLTSMNNLAAAYQTAGRLDKSIRLFEETLQLRKAQLGPDHPDTLTTMGNLAAAYQTAGKPALALPLLEETLKLRKAQLGPDHPDTLSSMNNLAAAYYAANKLDLALPLIEETLQFAKAQLGPDHPDTLKSMANLAIAYRTAGKLDKSLRLLEETLKLQEAKLGRDHPDTLTSMNSLARSYHALHRHTESQAVLADLIERLQARLIKHPEEGELAVTLGEACCNLGDSLRDHGQASEALPWFAKGQTKLEQLLVQEPNTATARLFLRNIHLHRAKTYEQLRRFADADADWAKAIDLSPSDQKAMVKDNQAKWKAQRKPAADKS